MNILGQLGAELVKQQLEEGMHKVVLNVGVQRYMFSQKAALNKIS